jgi:tRNA pseudouridine13 synthase
VSASGIRKDDLLALNIKDIRINGAWNANERVHMGGLLGNRFTIRVRESNEKDFSVLRSRSEAVAAELGNKFPNYFGEQRFGSSRKNTYQIGLKLLKGEIEDAVLSFLHDTEGETNTEARLARKELQETGNYAAAMNTFPRHLRLERSMIAQLSKRPDDFAGALRQLPRSTLLIFVHAVQSHLFNISLSNRLGEGELSLEPGEYFCGESSGFPDISKTEAEGWIAGKLIGYQTPLNEREKSLMEELGIEKINFRMKELPEINSKGSYRTLLAPMKDFSLSIDSSIVFCFSLPSGSYATVAMREFMKNGDGTAKPSLA